MSFGDLTTLFVFWAFLMRTTPGALFYRILYYYYYYVVKTLKYYLYKSDASIAAGGRVCATCNRGLFISYTVRVLSI